MTNKEIGQRIADTRIEKDLTMDDIAQKIGVAKSTIQRYEKGTIKKLKLPVIESIASALNVNPNWLIGNTDDPTPTEYKKEQPARTGELSEAKQAMYDFIDTLSDEQVRRLLQIAHAALDR